jgi:hypothetical protein
MGSLGFDLNLGFCLVLFIGEGAPLVVGFRFTHQSIFLMSYFVFRHLISLGHSCLEAQHESDQETTGSLDTS